MLDLDVQRMHGISAPDPRVIQALQAIAAAEGSLGTVARDLGVTLCTLQRLITDRAPFNILASARQNPERRTGDSGRREHRGYRSFARLLRSGTFYP